MNTKLYLTVLLIMFTISSCRQADSPPSMNDTLDTEESTGFEQLEVIKDIYYRFPAPDEMLAYIEFEDFKFNKDLPHPTEYTEQYLDSKSQALNLGVYIADMAYLTILEQHNDGIRYFDAVYQLSDKLRIASAFQPAMLIRIENNIKNADSLKVIADEALTDITNYLVQNEKEKTFAVISIGGFVESLYLAFHVAGEYSDDNPVIQRISDQKLVLDNLIEFSVNLSSDQSLTDAIELIQPVRDCYNQLLIQEEEKEVDKDSDGKIVIKGGSKVVISKEQYDKLREATFSVREKITQN